MGSKGNFESLCPCGQGSLPPLDKNPSEPVLWLHLPFNSTDSLFFRMIQRASIRNRLGTIYCITPAFSLRQNHLSITSKLPLLRVSAAWRGETHPGIEATLHTWRPAANKSPDCLRWKYPTYLQSQLALQKSGGVIIYIYINCSLQ